MRLELRHDESYIEVFIDKRKFAFVWAATAESYVVDSVNGVPPVSNLDLYNKLRALKSDQKSTITDEASATITYVGIASPGSDTGDSVWSVKRIDTSVAGEMVILYADGNSLEDNVWDDRAGLTYL